jgi:hypothetical protein
MGERNKSEGPKIRVHIRKWGRGISAAITGYAILLRGENSGEVVAAAYLLPHSLLRRIILYMNIIEFIHVAMITPLPTQMDRHLRYKRRFFYASSFKVYPVIVVQAPFSAHTNTTP